MNNIIKYIIGLLITVAFTSAHAQLEGVVLANWVANFTPLCFKAQKEKLVNLFNSDESLSKYCTCYALKTSQSNLINNGLVVLIERNEAVVPPGIHEGVPEFCQKNYEKYNSGAIEKGNESSEVEALFNGEKKRFVAIHSVKMNKNWKVLQSNEVQIGREIIDLLVTSDRSIKKLIDITHGIEIELGKEIKPSAFGKTMGYQLGFNFEGKNGIMMLDPTKQIIATQVYSDNGETIVANTYFSSNSIICKTLVEAKNRANSKIVGSIIKEALLIALRSYAGTSYSVGNFTATTTTGNQIAGTYQVYNNSWLGDHYSRGLDAIFNGVSSTSDIDSEMQKINCRK